MFRQAAGATLNPAKLTNENTPTTNNVNWIGYQLGTGAAAQNIKVLQEGDILENTYTISEITFQRQKDTAGNVVAAANNAGKSTHQVELVITANPTSGSGFPITKSFKTTLITDTPATSPTNNVVGCNPSSVGVVCNVSNEGETRYNSSLRQMEFCNGTAWRRHGQPDIIIAAEWYSANVGLVGCGGATSSCYQKRNLNHLISNDGNYGSVTGGNLTLQAGTYYCTAYAYAYRSEMARINLQIPGEMTLFGNQQHAEDTDYTSVAAELEGTFRITSQKTLQLWQWIRNGGGDDFGHPMEAGWPGYNARVTCIRYGD